MLAIYCLSKSNLQVFTDACLALYFGSRIGDPNSFIAVDDPSAKWPDSYHIWFLKNKQILAESINGIETVGVVLRNAGLIVNITRWIVILKARDYSKKGDTADSS